MRKIFISHFLSLAMAAVWFVPSVSLANSDPTLLEATAQGGTILTTRLIDRGLAIFNITGGENNADRVIELFATAPNSTTWQKLTDHNLPTNHTNVTQLQRFGNSVYAILTIGVNADTTELWYSDVSNPTQWTRIGLINVPYSQAVIMRFKNKIRLFNSDSEYHTESWVVKNNNSLQERSINMPFSDSKSQFLHHAFTLKEKLYFIVQVDNSYKLVSSTDGKNFIKVDSFPITGKLDIVTAVTKRDDRVLLAGLVDQKAKVWSTTDGDSWTELGKFVSDDSTIYEIDEVMINQAVPTLLLSTISTINPGNPNVSLYQYRNKKWGEIEQWDNMHFGNTLLRLQSQLTVLLNTANGLAVDRIYYK